MKRLTIAAIILALATVYGMPVWADMNVSAGGDDAHTHSDKATGKIVSLRAQTQGMEFGPKDDRLDAEILVRLENKPDMVFGIRHHEGASPAAGAMIDLLLEAYVHNEQVTLLYVQPPGQKNVAILWVELNR